jgi:hypothetical protein
MDAQGTCGNIAPQQSNRVPTAELWSFTTLSITNSWWRFLASFAWVDASYNSSYWTRYWGEMIALHTQISHFFLFNKCARALVACTGVNDLSHQTHLHPFFPLTMHNSMFAQSNTIFSAGKIAGCKTGTTSTTSSSSSIPAIPIPSWPGVVSDDIVVWVVWLNWWGGWLSLLSLMIFDICGWRCELLEQCCDMWWCGAIFVILCR